MKSVKVLVTGGTGQIGVSLIKELLHHRFDVTLLTRTTKEVTLAGKKLKQLIGDISDRHSLQKNKKHFDVIIHLAAAKRMFEKGDELKKTNITGLKNILDVFCSHSKEAFFIFASSIDAKVRKSDYALSKLKGEAIVKRFALAHPRLKYLNLRIGNVSFPDLNNLSGWRKSLLYHELGRKDVYPIELDRLSRKMISLVRKPKFFGRTIEVYDRKVKVAHLIKEPPPKLKFGHLILSIWNFLGSLTRRGDLLIYLKSQK